MALSPNYGWAEPDNSSLVKNGAQDIRALGDAIDTSVWNVGYGQAGKNKIINGDFNINQRAFTSTTTEFVYGVDRFFMRATGGTSTYSVQALTPGSAPVAGYEAKQNVRLVSTGQSGTGDRTILRTYIESVRTFAGQTVTISFWAKAATGTPNICPSIFQSFGTGGSPSANADWGLTTKKTITTSWARYSFTGNVPSIAGKTIGTTNDGYIAVDIAVSAGSTLTQFDGIGLQSNTFDIWGLQVEYGSKATPFQTATGTIQGELSAAQRYYYRANSTGGYKILASGVAGNTGSLNMSVQLPTQMRVIPTSLETSAMASYYYESNAGGTTPTTVTLATSSTENVGTITVAKAASFTAGYAYWLFSNNTAAYLGFSAEL
jgi:hypothetical protein